MMSKREIRLKGTAASDGIALGKPFFLSASEDEVIPDFSIGAGEIDQEISRYRKALFSSREDLKRLQSALETQGSLEAVTIIDTHLQMLNDPLITTDMEERIRQMRRNTEVVFRSAIKDFEKKFSKVKDSFFRQRFVDVKDLSKRILNHLNPHAPQVTAAPAYAIIFASELAPSYTAAVTTSQVCGFVSQLGGGNSHAALIARSKGLPYVASIDIPVVLESAPKFVIVDGGQGLVILDPEPATISEYERKKEEFECRLRNLEQEGGLKAETRDGYTINVFANISRMEEMELMHQHGASGVGLFRSEYLFLENATLFQAEEEQYVAYRALGEGAGGLPVVIRVLDVGGDKNHQQFGLTQKELEVYRGIRLLLKYKDIFRTQLRAILRASFHADIRILLPLVSQVEELYATKELIEEVKAELRNEGKPHRDEPLIGCMIEVPSAVIISGTLAAECDFLSMGTNDLVQYTLGVDRSNPLMNDFSFPAHPSIIHMIKMSADEARKHHKPFSICGEIASSPFFIPLLLGLGVEGFSCAPRYIPAVKKVIRATKLEEAKKLAERVLNLKTSAEITKTLTHTDD
ncbi:MAG: phosphoenolpyruvate--protein phosphotransferase [Chlamydiales bacterium]